MAGSGSCPELCHRRVSCSDERKRRDSYGSDRSRRKRRWQLRNGTSRKLLGGGSNVAHYVARFGSPLTPPQLAPLQASADIGDIEDLLRKSESMLSQSLIRGLRWVACIHHANAHALTHPSSLVTHPFCAQPSAQPWATAALSRHLQAFTRCRQHAGGCDMVCGPVWCELT